MSRQKPITNYDPLLIDCDADYECKPSIVLRIADALILLMIPVLVMASAILLVVLLARWAT